MTKKKLKSYDSSHCFSGPVLALGLAREDAVTGWRNMLGPKELEEAKEKEPERYN